jgi:hypothetical protein
MSILRDILKAEDVPVAKPPSGPRGMAIGEATGEMIRACSRLTDLLNAPQDIPFLGKHIHSEILYRLLREYRRHFGRPPMQDVQAFRSVSEVET